MKNPAGNLPNRHENASHKDLSLTRSSAQAVEETSELEMLSLCTDDSLQPIVKSADLIHGMELVWWARRYVAERVMGQSPHTIAAKERDLSAFIQWFVEVNGHARIDRWLVRDSQLFVRQLESAGRAPASINRALATLRHFCKWVHEQPGGVFVRIGLPTAGIHDLVVEEGDCKKLERRDMHALFKAADHLILLSSHKKSRPRRNLAVLSLLYYTGLRVQELCNLQVGQYDGKYLLDVVRKGRVRTKRIFLVAEARRALDDYIQSERMLDDPQSSYAPLLLTCARNKGLNRRDVARALDQIAEEASKHRAQKIHLHPHRLRHTFGSQHREKFGSDTETAAALGHTGLKYVGRYVRRSQQERDLMMEALFKDE